MLEEGEEMDHELDLLLLRLPVSANHDLHASADVGRSWQAVGAPTLDLPLAFAVPDVVQPDVAQANLAWRWATAGLVSLLMWGGVVAGVSSLL